MRWVFICLWKSFVKISNALKTKKWFDKRNNWLNSIYSILTSHVINCINVLTNRRSRCLYKYASHVSTWNDFKFFKKDAFFDVNSYENDSLIDNNEIDMIETSQWRRDCSIEILLIVEIETFEIWVHLFMSWLLDWQMTHWCFQKHLEQSMSLLKRLQRSYETSLSSLSNLSFLSLLSSTLFRRTRWLFFIRLSMIIQLFESSWISLIRAYMKILWKTSTNSNV